MGCPPGNRYGAVFDQPLIPKMKFIKGNDLIYSTAALTRENKIGTVHFRWPRIHCGRDIGPIGDGHFGHGRPEKVSLIEFIKYSYLSVRLWIIPIPWEWTAVINICKSEVGTTLVFAPTRVSIVTVQLPMCTATVCFRRHRGR